MGVYLDPNKEFQVCVRQVFDEYEDFLKQYPSVFCSTLGSLTNYTH